MKAHEQWLEDFYACHRGNDRFTPNNEMGWREALKWFRREALLSDEQCGCGHLSRVIIDEELNGD